MVSPTPPRRLAISCSLMLACCSVPGVARGQPRNLSSANIQSHGFVINLPAKSTVSPRTGLWLSVDNLWVNNFGYRPFKVTVTSPKSTTADHVITIRLYATSWPWQAGAVSVEQVIEMPLGSTSVKAVIASPHFQPNIHYWWDVWVDGVKDKSLSVEPSDGWQLTAPSAGNPAETTPKFLILGPPAQTNQMVSPGSDLFEALVLTPADLPTRWLDYTCVDAMSLSPTDLQSLAGTRPDALTAVVRWVRAGGQLWVSPVGRQWEQIAEIERLLQLPTSSDDASETGIADRGWRPIKFKRQSPATGGTMFLHLPTDRTRLVQNANMIERFRRDPDWIVTQELDAEAVAASTDAAAQTLPADSGQWYVQRPFGLGYVRAFRMTWDPAGFGFSWRMLLGNAPLNPSAPSTPLTAAMETTRNWESRHGMAPDAANADFANLLVPDVGQAPVTEFRVLITAFVLLIGPLNFWLLKRANRLHLLVLTVPMVAAVLTAGLFAYALASDGFGTKVRVRSFTTLDARTGEAACWARLSYYAGLAPSRGLILPDDVVAYPIRSPWNEFQRRSFGGVTRQIEWTGDEGRFTQGWLRSRTPMQYLTIRARKSPHRLQLKSAGERRIATNQLRTTIQYLAAVDDDGNVFQCDELANDATAELQPTTRSESLRRLRRFVLDHEPEMPPELVDESAAYTSARRQRVAYQSLYGFETSNERLSDNLLEDAIAALAGTGGRDVVDLPPRSYVAVTTTGPEVEIGIPGAEEQASFHVLVGNW